MRELWTCPINGGSCRPATEEERLDWDRREYLQLLLMNPDNPRLQHLFPEHLRKPGVESSPWDHMDAHGYRLGG